MNDFAELLAPPSEAAVAAAIAAYGKTVAEAYGSRLAGLHLFGSRARGDHRPDSDVDLAVVLTVLDGGAAAEKMKLIDLAFDALTDAGVMIQPWPFTSAEWSGEGQGGRFADMLVEAKRDARQLRTQP